MTIKRLKLLFDLILYTNFYYCTSEPLVFCTTLLLSTSEKAA